MRTDFQERLIKIYSGDLNFSKDEQAFIDEHFGPPLTEKQVYGLYCRYHIHLTPEEKGEGFETVKSNMRNAPKRGLPKSLRPILEPLTNDKDLLKKRWSLLSKTLWWHKFVRHKDVDDNIWNIAEELLALYPNGRKSVLIDMENSIKQRTVIVKNVDTNLTKEN